VFCVGLSPAEPIEADAPPASDKAPATPNAVTTLLRPLPFEVCFERDIVTTSLWLPQTQPKSSLALACAPYKALSLLQSSGSLAMSRVERRGRAKENAELQSTVRTQTRAAVSQAQARIREAVIRNRQDRLTALLHHLTVDVLRASFFGPEEVPRARCRRDDVDRIRRAP
jgi:hypothetical protein